MIHKSDVYFDVVMPMLKQEPLSNYTSGQLHHGDIYIYTNKIYLRDDERWYKADIRDIKDIKTMISRKQILIQFLNYDVVLSSKEYSHLLALRDFLNLAQSYVRSRNSIILGTRARRRIRDN